MATPRPTVRLEVSAQTKLAVITLDRPRQKNAVNLAMYDEIAAALARADADDRCTVALLTGAGDYFSSGNDLVDAASQGGEPRERAESAAKLLRRFTSAILDFKKPLIAAVNGPAIGIACTLLGLCDVVWCSDTAFFLTPFARLGQSPEGVSSLTFPAAMGMSNAMEVLMLGRRLSAADALRLNLVSDVIPAAQFRGEARRRAEAAAALPPITVRKIKALVRSRTDAAMRKAMHDEVDLLTELWQGEECMEAIMRFVAESMERRERARKQKASKL